MHGGEALLSPLLFPLLSALASARAGRAYSVHLLSNGMLLSRQMVGRLIDQGVNSLSISLDGGSAQTNDRLRLGADFARILANLGDAVSLRRERGADLRLGVSLVLTRDNQHELPDLARRLADLGIDWLKIEEMCPLNLVAIEQLVPPDGLLAATRMADLRRAGFATGDRRSPAGRAALSMRAGRRARRRWRDRKRQRLPRLRLPCGR